MTPLLTLALALYGAAALPHSKRGLDDPGCLASVPANPEPDTVNKIYLAAVALNANQLVMQATFETCLQESNCCNLQCGDQASGGAFQQQTTQGWGTWAEVTNVTHAANSFLAVAIPLAAANPSWTPNQIAQGVQQAQAGDLYGPHLQEANDLIQQAADATGVPWGNIKPSGGGSSSSGGGSSDGSPPDDDCGGSSTPPPSSGGGQSSGCQTYTAVSGDYCYLIAQNNGIDVSSFLSWNPSVSSDCSNLQVGTAYCISAP